MSDDFKSEINLVVHTQGVDNAKGALEALQKAFDDATRSAAKSGKDMSRELEVFSRAINALEKSMGKGKDTAKRYAEGFAELVKGVSDASKALREAAQLSVVGGSNSPLRDVAAGMSLGEAREILAVQKARGLTAEQVAAEVVSAHNREEQAARSVAEAERKLSQSVKDARTQLISAQGDKYYSEKKRGLSEIEAATLDVTRANGLLATAEAKVRSAQSTGNKGAQVSALREQAEATRRVTTADEALFRAQQNLNKGTSTGANNLPRLRYALYDVSSSLGIAGAAMLALGAATVGTAIKMDRQFADVVRTSGTYLDRTGASTKQLRQDFNELFTSLPTSWGDLAEIGTLAGQLGVASENIAEFTQLVTKFSATTDVSVEQSATAFGRLTELLGLTSAQYENLGSAILATGTSSVATESQIINTSSQIASMGNFAGLTADEVIGLSSSLASLGVQPELSRGTVTRFFTILTTAISEGGDKLDKFGAIAKMSGKDFADAWRADRSDAIITLLQGLQSQGDGAITTLKGLGITASRDVPTLLKLAQNYELVGKQFEISSQGFADGTALQEQYGVVAETVASKLTILKNNITQLISAAGGASDVLGPFIDGLTKILQFLGKFADNEAVQAIALVTLGITALGGAVLVTAALFARGYASAFALQTALLEMAGSAYTAKTGLDATAASTWNLINASKAARAALISTGIGAALVAIGSAAAYFIGKADEAAQKNKQLMDSFTTSLQTDTGVWEKTGEGVVYYERELSNAVSTNDKAAQSASDLVGEMAGVSQSVDDATEKTRNYVVALGEATDAAIQASLVDWILGGEELTGEEQLARVTALRDGLEMVGLTFEDIKAAAKDKDTQFFSDLEVQALQGMQAAAEEAGYSMEFMDSETQAAWAALQTLADQGQNTTDTLFEAALGATAAELATSLLGGSADEAGDEFSGAEEQLRSLTEGIFDAINAEYALIGATYDLGASLANNGLDFSESTAAGRANLASLIQVLDAAGEASKGNADLLASYIQQIITQLTAAGVQGAASLAPITEVLASLGGATGTTVTDMVAFNQLTGQVGAGMASVANESANTARNIGKAKKEIRTLSDYVSDLDKVMSDAFEFRFGLQESKDDVQSTIYDITNSFEEARQKVRDLALEIQDLKAQVVGLSADRSKLEYFLSVALEYGDSLRAAQIQAELEKNAADAAKAQEELAKATKEQEKASADATPTLTGNTEEAIEQRAAVLQLVQGVQDQIAAYAATGASQEQVEAYAKKLKAQLEAQLKAWGYNTSEVKTYTSAIDDFVEIIKSVPRNLTVKVGTDTSPADKALAEFFAENKDKTITTTQKIVTKVPPPQGISGAAQRIADYANLVKLQNEAAGWAKQGNYEKAASYGPKIQALADKIKANKYYVGGFTGPGGKYEPAGIVHKGEYVVRKELVNQSTGLPYADAFDRISRGTRVSQPSYANGGFASGNGLSGAVSLTPGTIQQLAMAVQPYLVINNRVLEDATSSAYAGSTRIGAN